MGRWWVGGSTGLLLMLAVGCPSDDDFPQGTASGGLGPCSDECEVDADCPDQHACFEVGGDVCGFECLAVECTSDEHCSGGGVCSLGDDREEHRCLPPSCAGATLIGFTMIDDAASIAALSGVRCLHGSLHGTQLASLVGLEALELVTGAVFLYDTPQLSTVEGLGGLVEVESLDLERNAVLEDLSGLVALSRIDSVYIHENPSLPAAEIEGLLARVAPTGTVKTCGNLDDMPCDPGT